MRHVLTALTALILVPLAAARSLPAVPNADRLFIDGHLWYDLLSPTPRTQSNGALNAFGAAYTSTPSWSTLCPLDSDGDGFTNGEELGDPQCVWTIGAVPYSTTGLSHPGLYSSVPVDTYPARSRTAQVCARDADSVGDNRVALRSPTVAAPSSIRRLTKTFQVAAYRLPDKDNFTESRASCPHLQSGLRDWHDATLWPGGSVPVYNTDVTLPANTRVLVSSCSVDPRGYRAITIPAGSQLIFADAAIFMRVKDILVQGDLVLGSATCPLHSPITISFMGEKSEVASYSNGATASGSGSLRMHGTRNNVTWTRLAATILPGGAHVLVQDAVGWGPGDEIVVATSIYRDLENDQNEVRTVVNVSADGKTLVVDRPFAFKHWASLEYQTEVGLLTRSIILRGGVTATQRRDRFGGHTMAAGSSAAIEMVGVRAQRMGQQNILGRYSFHMHLVINGTRSSIQQVTCDHSYFRCVSVHKTNHTLLRKNVAYNVSANCYYLEDGSEMFNRIEYNFAVRVQILGTPASGGSQVGSQFNEDAVAIQPADHTAAGFYISNPHNYVIGNAASGGWAGFSFPIFPYTQRLSSDIKLNPSTFPILEFDGNTAHSAGYYWGDQGCIYFGGRLTDVNGKFVCSNGRFSHPTNGMHNVTNLRTWLCNRGLSSWDERVELRNYEAHDVLRSAVLFGQSSISNMIVTGNTDNLPRDMLSEGRQGFGFYDTWVQTSVTNTTFRNFWQRSATSKYNRDAIFVDLDHSDIFKPWYISATRNLRMDNVDNALRVVRWIRETGASRMFNVVDWDGSLVGLPSCSATIIGSDIDWWNGDDDCWYNDNWPAWLCPRKPGREVVGIDVDLPGISSADGIDVRTDDTDQLSAADRAAVNIGHFSHFGSRSNRRLQFTRNHHAATGLSGIGWYMYLTTGVPQTIKVWPQNFATTGTFIMLAISYPAGTTFSIRAVPRWNAFWTQFTKVTSRPEMLASNGTAYYFDGRHLYIKVMDMWSTYPNAYTRNRVSIPNVMETGVDVVITASCTSKNGAGYCKTPASPDPPADMDLETPTCSSRSEQTRPTRAEELCPQLDNVMPPASVDPGAATTSDCDTLTGYGGMSWGSWRCSGYDLPAKGYCRASCNSSCRVYNPQAYRCSFMDECIADEFVAPRADTCGDMNNWPLSDECTMKTCDATKHGNSGWVPLAYGAPCNYNEGLGQGACDGNFKCSVKVKPPVDLPVATRVTDRPSFRSNGFANIAQLYVTRPEVVTSVTVAVQNSPGAPLTTMSMTKSASQSTAVSALFDRTFTQPIRRNVTVTISTSLPSPNATLTYNILDWNAKANVVPSFGAPIVGVDGSFSITVDPIDWVGSATLYTSRGEGAVSVALTCDYGTDSRCTATNVPTLSGGAHVSLSMLTGVNVNRSLPCLTSALIGSMCNTAVHTVRSSITCKVGLVIQINTAWWIQLRPSPSTNGSTIAAVIAVSPTAVESPLTRQSWGDWSGGSWNPSIVGTGSVKVVLTNGATEVFILPPIDTSAVGDGLVCKQGSLLPVADYEGTQGQCTAVNKCVPGLGVTTTITTTTTSTATTSTTPSPTVAVPPGSGVAPPRGLSWLVANALLLLALCTYLL